MALYTDNAQPESESSSSAVLKIVYEYKKFLTFFVVAKLKIADILSKKPTIVDEFAKNINVNSRKGSYHLMRLLVKMNIFFGGKNDEFPLNPIRKLLLTGTSNSLRGKFWQALLNTGMNGRLPNCYEPNMVSFVTSSEKLIHTVNQQRLLANGTQGSGMD